MLTFGIPGDAGWLVRFAASAATTDRLAAREEHTSLLALGLLGEAGGLVAELKKQRRELDAYQVYRDRMLEEMGDFLWYFVRLADSVDPHLAADLQVGGLPATEPRTDAPALSPFVQFARVVGTLVVAVTEPSHPPPVLRTQFQSVWNGLVDVAGATGLSLRDAADRNQKKTHDRWPQAWTYPPLFDDGFPEEERLPRTLEIEFRERRRGDRSTVILRVNGLNFGDALTDNIQDPDGYRYHDVFHFANAAHLGWSPVLRALLRCKRKSASVIDEGQDGARAAIIEEGVSAIVFARAKELRFFEGLEQVDFELLKTVKAFTRGFEVEVVPFWLWERAILDGFRVFRLLRDGGGGCVTLDLNQRRLEYARPSA
jgi:NTP pyrophosphatase (non-canonical NTP hydrolase)